MEKVSRHIPRHDYNTLSFLPSAIADIIQETGLQGKAMVARLYLNSTRRLIASGGAGRVRSTGDQPWRGLRSLRRLIKHNLNSITMAYLIGKAAKQSRSQRRREDAGRRNVEPD